MNIMQESRRIFLGAVFSLAVAAKLGAAQQQPPKDMQEPLPFPGAPRIITRPPESRRDPKAELKQNQDHIKKDVARLTELVADLQKGLDDSDTKEVLSINVIRKAEEIEKLAKQIRDLVRG
jgi:hypothetical protein